MDRRQRTRERRARGTGDANDRALYLADKLRGGLISRDALVIAALFGDTSARAVVPDAPTPPTPGVPCAKLGKRGSVHGLRVTAAHLSKHGIDISPWGGVRYPRTFCGRDTQPNQQPDRPSGRPTCRTCMRSEYWQGALSDALAELIARVADTDPAVGFRCGMLAVEHVLDGHLCRHRDSNSARKFAEYALWGSGAILGRPPAPGSNPDTWDPAGLFDRGVHAWLYGLGVAALELHDKAPSLPVSLRTLARIVAAVVTTGGDAQASIINLINLLREAIVPYVLGDEPDPLLGLAVVYRDIASRHLTQGDIA